MKEERIRVSIASEWWKSNPKVTPSDSAYVLLDKDIPTADLDDFIEFLHIFKSVSIVVPHQPNDKLDFTFASQLRNLDEFRMLMFEFNDFSQFNCLPATIKKFELADTNSKRLSLSLLESFPMLVELRIAKHKKDIESISCLKNLKSIVFRSITVPDLGFLSNSKNLESVKLLLGGTTNLSSLSSFEKLNFLELWRINGLTDLNDVSRLQALEHLELQELTNVEKLPNFYQNICLSHLSIDNLKNLTDLSSIRSAKSLEEFSLTSALGLDPNHLKECVLGSSIKRINAGFGSKRKNDDFGNWAKLNGFEQLI